MSIQRYRPKYFKQIFIRLFGILCLISTGIYAKSPQKSCRDHFLSGNHKSGIYPLAKDLTNPNFIYRVYCQFPEFGSSHLFITTVIRNGMERWLLLKDQEKKTIGYQIKDFTYLRSVISDSDYCFQDLLIKWPILNNSGNETKERTPEFSIETFNGKQHNFYKNVSNSESLENVRIEGKNEAGIRHTFASESMFEIRASALQCRQSIVKNAECLFEIGANGISDTININFDQIDSNLYKTFAFSFRTESPKTSFLSIKTNLDETIPVDLIDGYLIAINHFIHPIKLLSDGRWHRLYLDLKSLSLSFDDDAYGLEDNDNYGKSVSISLIGGSSAKITQLQIHLIAQITAMELLPSAEARDKKDNLKYENRWLCQDDTDVLSFEQGPKGVSTPFFATRICWPGEKDNSYCNCKGPNSAMERKKNGQYATCSLETNENYPGVQLNRHSDKLAFLLVKNFDPKNSISLLFKSEKKTGLLLFGSWKLTDTSKLSNAHESSRLQIHFVGEKMFVAQCFSFSDGQETCYSCFVSKKNGFDTGEFIRLSLFSYQMYKFMAVNELICQLSPNSPYPDSSELYKPILSNTAASSVFGVQNLFIGGTYYSKLNKLNQMVDRGFQRDFQENTREKAPSLQVGLR